MQNKNCNTKKRYLIGIRQTYAEMVSHYVLDAAVMECKWETGKRGREGSWRLNL